MGTNINNTLFKFLPWSDQVNPWQGTRSPLKPVLTCSVWKGWGALPSSDAALFMNITTFIIIIIDVILSPQKLGPIILRYPENLVQRQIIKAENPLKARYFHVFKKNSGRMVFLIMGPRKNYRRACIRHNTIMSSAGTQDEVIVTQKRGHTQV